MSPEHAELVEQAVQAALDAGVAENGSYGVASARVAARFVVASLAAAALRAPVTVEPTDEMVEVAWVAFRDSDKPAPWNQIKDALRAAIALRAPVDDQGVHLTHCNQDENEGVCKYGEDETCPALRAPVEMNDGQRAKAICEALGFDPTNHHNAAKCPYCQHGLRAPVELGWRLLQKAHDHMHRLCAIIPGNDEAYAANVELMAEIRAASPPHTQPVQSASATMDESPGV